MIVRSLVEICLGTSPSQAPKSRPLENTSPVPIAATMALGSARCQAPSSGANMPDLDGPVLRSRRIGHRCADPAKPAPALLARKAPGATFDGVLGRRGSGHR